MNPRDAFDVAFRPTQDQIDRLAEMFGSVVRANLVDESADVMHHGQVYAVSPKRCEICDEWEPDCDHVDMVKAFVAQEIAIDDELYGDHMQEKADLYAMANGR